MAQVSLPSWIKEGASRVDSPKKSNIMFTPQKSNELIPIIAIFKGSDCTLSKAHHLGIQPLVFGSVYVQISP